jgi:hypothetical protein
MAFFDLWLGQKLQPTAYGADQPNPNGFTGLDSLASDFSEILGKDQNYFQSDPNAQTLSAKVRGLLDIATKTGFPTPQGALEQLADFVNGIISAVWSLITAVWDAIVNFVGSVANFLLAVWNNIVGPVLGAAIEVVKSVIMFEIELVKTFISTILNTPSSTVNPEETKTYVTQQLFKQNVMQSYQGDYDSQPPVDISADPFGPLMNVMPVIQPLMQIGSIGSLLTSFVQMPSIIVELINILGSGGVMSVMFEVINVVVTQAIQLLFNQLIAPVIPDLLNVFSIQSLFSQDEISYLEAVLDGEAVNPNINFDDLYNKILFLPFQTFESIKGIPLISNAFGLLINGTVDLLSGVIGFIQVLNSAIDIDLLFSFAFQLLSRLFFSYATYITYPPGINENPSVPGDYTSNRQILIGELGLDFLGILSSFISWGFAKRLNDRYPDGRFGQVSTYAFTFVAVNLGESLEDVSKFIIYGVAPLDSQHIKTITTIGGVLFWIGNLFKVFGFLYYLFFTGRDKLSRLSEMSLPELFGTLATLVNTVLSAIIAWFSFKSGRDYVNKVQTAIGGLENFFNWALTKTTVTNSRGIFTIAKMIPSMKPPNSLNPIPLKSISKNTFLGLTLIGFGLDITLYLSSALISR